ncbi:hypothetical protein Tco_0389389 [Tanacetum coccineum]
MYYGQHEEILKFRICRSKFCCSELSGSTLAMKDWKGVQDVNHKKFSNEGVIVVEDDHDVIHFNNSSDLALFTSLNDLYFVTLNIDGQSTDVEAPPDIIDVKEEYDFIDDEDGGPHDLVDFDDEVPANDDDDDVAVVYSNEEKD